MVFQDGGAYLDKDVQAAVVFDNLIHKGDMPVTIGLFVDPGDKGPGSPAFGGTDNRSFEYDSLGDQYARFVLEELIPEATKQHRIVDDPAGRAICGLSSGGICAFTAGIAGRLTLSSFTPIPIRMGTAAGSLAIPPQIPTGLPAGWAPLTV